MTAPPAYSSVRPLSGAAGQSLVILLRNSPVVPPLPLLDVPVWLLKPRPLGVVDPEVDIFDAI